MSAETWKRIEQLLLVLVSAAVVSAMNWFATHGVIKADIESAKIELSTQTTEQTATMKAEAKKTRQKVVEETNETTALVAQDAREVAAELVAAPVEVETEIKEMLRDMRSELQQLKSERAEAENP